MPDPESKPIEPVDSGELALSLGITVPHLRNLRRQHLAEGADWFRSGNSVLIQPEGVEKLRLAIGLEAEKAPPATPPATLKATVVSSPRAIGGVRKHFPNAGIIRCAIEGTGELVWVRVRNSANYFPRLRSGDPMILAVQQQPDGRWQALGRAPRFPARW